MYIPPAVFTLSLLLSTLSGQALLEMGESLKQMADVKYSLDDNTKQNFLEPLHSLQMKDLKEVMVSNYFRPILICIIIITFSSLTLCLAKHIFMNLP